MIKLRAIIYYPVARDTSLFTLTCCVHTGLTFNFRWWHKCRKVKLKAFCFVKLWPQKKIISKGKIAVTSRHFTWRHFVGVCVCVCVFLCGSIQPRESWTEFKPENDREGVRGEGNEKNRRFSPPSTEKSEKRVTCFATFLKNKLNSDIALFTTEESNLSCNSQVAGFCRNYM